MSNHIDGEEEQLELAEPLIQQAIGEFAKLSRRPVPDRVAELLRWIARQCFRLGYQHAHERNTVKDNLWPHEEVTKNDGR